MKSMFGVVVVGIALIGGCSYGVHTATQEQVTFTVTDKERIVEKGGASSKYLIYTNAETFENTDSLLAMKFNSSDVYGRLQEGQTCTATVVGFRNSFLSMYRNILTVSCE